MAAFRLANSSGAEMIETDVRLTKDLEFVVHHDRNLGRTTNGRGSVWKRNCSEITHLDAGFWFHPRFAGETVPSLRGVLAWLPPLIGLNIEVKTDGDWRPRSLVARRLCAILAESFTDYRRLLVSSFDHRLLRCIRAVNPFIPIGVLYMAVRDAGRKPSVLAGCCGASAFICSRAQIRKRHVRDAHAHNLDVNCYGVNTQAHLATVVRHGVEGVITDFPARMVHLLRSMETCEPR